MSISTLSTEQPGIEDDHEATPEPASVAEALHESSVRLGEQLRAVREERRLSLKDVEAQSESEFKASVLGAYERAERMVSVERLDRLAQFYDVPVERLLPRARSERSTSEPASTQRLVLDLGKLGALRGSPFDKLARYVRLIREQRSDFDHPVITVRAEDVQAIAAMLQVPVSEVGDRLAALDLTH